MKKLLAAVLLATALWPAYQAASADDNDVWAASLGVGNAPVEPPRPVLDTNLSLAAPSASLNPVIASPAAPAPSVVPPAVVAPAMVPATPVPPAAGPQRVVTAPAAAASSDTASVKPVSVPALALAAPSAPPATPPKAAPPTAASALPPGEGSLYIAGNQFTLEQAFADATIEKLNAPGSKAFVILAMEREMAKLTAKGAKDNIKAAVRELQRAGGAFFLCERDLKQANLSAKDLLPGIRVERGLNAKELQPTSVESAQAGTSVRRIRRACSGDDDPSHAVIASGRPPAATAPPPRPATTAR